MKISIALLALVALTGTADAGFIDIGQAFSQSAQPYINAAIEAGITALVSWALLKLSTKFHVDIEAKHRDALVQFLQRQASSLLAKGEVKLQGTKITVNNEVLAGAANAAISAIPEALKFFNLNPEQLKGKILDLVPQQPAVASAMAVALDAKNPETPTPGLAAGITATHLGGGGGGGSPGPATGGK